MQKVTAKILNNQLTHLEKSLLDLANQEIKKGHDILYLDLFLHTELETWKRERIKYRNAPTTLERVGRVMIMRHNGAALVRFESHF